MAKRLPVPRSEDFAFRCEVAVRFRDLDAMGHVNNAVYLTYFEIARSGYLRALGHVSADECSLPGLFPFILAEVSCRFLAPARLAEVLVVSMRTTAVGARSFEFEYLITSKDTERPVAVGYSTQVYYDYHAGETREVPQDFLAHLEAFEGRSLRVRP